jgi:hypothetical protein
METVCFTETFVSSLPRYPRGVIGQKISLKINILFVKCIIFQSLDNSVSDVCGLNC